MSRLYRPKAAVLAASVAALVALPLAAAPAHADPSELPSADPFYTYSGTTPLAEQPAGAVLARRDVTLQLGDKTVQAEQLLYRTKDEQGRPSVTVTTVANPDGAKTKGIVAYLSYYDGLGDRCDPSYTLQGGGAGAGAEATVVSLLIGDGYAVTVPDFEGETLDWAAGDESGWDTLDAVRATETELDAPATTKVGLLGYSGGSIAGDWASELAPAYAPELNMIGTAIGGVPANLGNLMTYVDGSMASAGVIPAAMISLSRAFGVDFSQYESQRGLDDTAAIKDDCIADFTKTEAGVRIADLLKPEYADFLDLPPVAAIVDHLRMGTGGQPTVPMMILNGKSDDTGDGIMVTADVKALADTYCQEGLPVQYTQLDGQNHTQAGTSFIFKGLSYLDQRFAGGTPPSTCAAKAAPAPSAIHPTVRSSSRGRRDVIVVSSPKAVGATVKVVRLSHGHQAVVGRGTIGDAGRARIAVRDRNGNQATRYRALVAATATTKAGVTRTITQR